MNNKQSEEKQRIFLNMLDHPEKYTTKEIEALLADEEISSFASYLTMTKRAMKRHEDEDIDVNAEWEHFAIEHSIPQRRNWKRIAASTIGIIFISGLAFAATVQLGILPFFGSKKEVERHPKTPHITATNSIKKAQAERKAVSDSLNRVLLHKTDSIPPQPIVFEDTSLKTIVDAMAAYYHVDVKVLNPVSTHIRLYFKWDRQCNLQQNIELLNAFDRVKVSYSDNTLTIE
ncbi:DUF4974 domain-containing protein [Prevotella jejuni]